MNKPDNKYVYHGSKDFFEIAKPKRQIRKRMDKFGRSQIIFDETSFHATPYKWLAVAYTFDPDKLCPGGSEKNYYHIGVDLYDYVEELEIYGVGTLDKTLSVLYGTGGYLMTFNKADFSVADGLGHFELITKKSLKPVSIERIDDPVSVLNQLGISFKFIDLSKE